jgi:hypothetical protein
VDVDPDSDPDPQHWYKQDQIARQKSTFDFVLVPNNILFRSKIIANGCQTSWAPVLRVLI